VETVILLVIRCIFLGWNIIKVTIVLHLHQPIQVMEMWHHYLLIEVVPPSQKEVEDLWMYQLVMVIHQQLQGALAYQDHYPHILEATRISQQPITTT
jgi:hypothetical protein